jgi:hypothetical protein
LILSDSKRSSVGSSIRLVAVWVDLGFLEIRHHISDAKIFIPHKKPKGKALSDEQRKENTAMARIRVKIEHMIGERGDKTVFYFATETPI